MTTDRKRSSALKTLIGAAAGLAVMALASQASAVTYVKLISASMNQTFQANITGDGNVISNGINFKAQASTAGGVVSGPIYDLFGFCVDVFHNIGLGNLGYVYQSNEDLNIVNPLPTDFGGHAINATQLQKIEDLVNTGYYLHQGDLTNANFDTQMRLAAIQAAIWKVEVGPGTVPNKTIVVNSTNLTTGANPYLAYANQYAAYQDYFNNYTAGTYTKLGDQNDRFYVISDGVHQSFAIGWPIPGVPEPTTWAMMIGGLFGVGSLLRSRRKALALAA